MPSLRFNLWITTLTIGLSSQASFTRGQDVATAPSQALATSTMTHGGENAYGGRYTGLWGPTHAPSAYRVLPRPTDLGTIPASPVNPQRARPSMPYSYGWFGPKQTPSWSRSFGVRKGYTQWTLK